ncbi:MAG: hypothetical protein OEW48_20595 [Phycisphaerae bacterium]|nr:hypothetical protein [Phycisphaerae bacterium]
MKSIIRKLISPVKNWKWFAFAIFMTLWLGFPFVGGIIINTYYPLLLRLGISVDLISLLAFWGLALQKKFFYQFFWRLFFFVDVLLFVLNLLFGPRYDLPLLWCIIIYGTSVVFSILWYMGLFIYAFRSKQIWGRTELKPKTIPIVYSQYKWVIRKKWLRENIGLHKWLALVPLIIVCLTFTPMIIRNNRVIYPQGSPPEFYKRMLKYRRTTISQLPEFERLFPNYLCDKDISISKFIFDPNNQRGNIAYRDPNSPVRWCLTAGLHKRYLLIMKTDLVYAKIDPETEKIISPGSHEEPLFSLREVSSISIMPRFVLFEQRYAVPKSKELKILTADEWKKLVKADGDFSVLGIELKKKEPIPNFEFAFRNNQ